MLNGHHGNLEHVKNICMERVFGFRLPAELYANIALTMKNVKIVKKKSEISFFF